MDLSFGFDDPNFSDRTLLLEIIGDAHTDDDCPQRLRDAERRRCDDLPIKASTVVDTTLSSPPLVKTIHVTSLILAGSSPFFRKLFSNGMQESEQKHATLRIEALEEVSFMDLLKYIYSNNLPTTLDALLDLSLTADKFEVVSCLRDCTRALQKLPMTPESASIYLDLPPCLLMSPTVEPLLDAAKQILAANFRNLDEFKGDVLNLPLLGLQAVLSSDNLQVTSEIVVYDTVLAWVRKHYPNMEERREILKTHLLHLVRFPFLTTTQLTKDVLTCKDIDPEHVSKIVICALSYKAETNSHRKRCLAAEEGIITSRQFMERVQSKRLVKVVEFESLQQCVVYLDLTRNELDRIFPEGDVWSETFHLDGLEFGLCASCSIDASLDDYDFGLALYVSNSSTCTIKYEFSVRTKHQEDSFRSWFNGTRTLTKTEKLKNVHSEEWTNFIGNDNSYFINDILRVKAVLTIKKFEEY